LVMSPVDVVFLHGRVHTVNARNDIVQALAVSGNRIVAVGSDEAVEGCIGTRTQVIDLRGRSLVPGFIDNHIHLENIARQLDWIDCSAAHSIADIVAAVRSRGALSPPGQWILGSRYQQDRLLEQRHPARRDLDKATTAHPVGLVHASGMAWTFNSTALRLTTIGPATPDPAGGRIHRDEHGNPTGVLWNNARRYVEPLLPNITQDERLSRYSKVCQRMNALGITTAVEAAYRAPDQLQAWQTLRASGNLSLRVNLVTYPVYLDFWDESGPGGHLFDAGMHTGFGDAWLRVGALCIGIDGTGLGRTAALLEPYADDPDASFTGMLRVTPEQLVEFCRKGHDGGWQLALVAMGDRGIQVSLDALAEAVNVAEPGQLRSHRHRLEHAYLWNPDLIQRCAELGVIWNTQPPLLQAYGRRSTLDAWGASRARQGFPFRDALQAGIVISGGSDAPVTTADPLVGLDCLLTHRLEPEGTPLNEEQTVGLADALRIYTYNGACACGEEQLKGSLEVGKLADLVVLSGDLEEAAPANVRQLRVDLTMVDGKVAYER
ncbi:MAG: amidohydrolase, partial [Candidatus Binatia bacterium]